MPCSKHRPVPESDTGTPLTYLGPPAPALDVEQVRPRDEALRIVPPGRAPKGILEPTGQHSPCTQNGGSAKGRDSSQAENYNSSAGRFFLQALAQSAMPGELGMSPHAQGSGMLACTPPGLAPKFRTVDRTDSEDLKGPTPRATQLKDLGDPPISAGEEPHGFRTLLSRGVRSRA